MYCTVSVSVPLLTITYSVHVLVKKTREEGPLLTVATEVKMGTQRVQMKGVLPWLVCWARRAGTRDFYPALAALVSPIQNILFSSPYTISIYVSPSHSDLGRPPLSECVVSGANIQ